MVNVDELLREVVKRNASDLHLTPDESPMLRVDGDLLRFDVPAIDAKEVREALEGVMTDKQKKRLQEELEVDFSYVLEGAARFRVNVFSQRKGISGAFRTIPFNSPSFEELDLPNLFKEFCSYPNGIVIVTGPTGSGKSTTLAAMINYINTVSGDQKHIITVEDPIEYVHESGNCLVQQREVGGNTLEFKNALRAALREDPDVILVGEMRDLETIQLALTAAETGHLVLTTMHTASAAKSIDRIIDAFPGTERALIRAMVAESLRTIVAQTLLKKPGGGRRAAFEIMVCTPAIRNLIREHKVPQIFSIIQTHSAEGMRTLEQHIEELVKKKLVIAPKKFKTDDKEGEAEQGPLRKKL